MKSELFCKKNIPPSPGKTPVLKLFYLPVNLLAVLEMERPPGKIELLSELLPLGKSIGVRTYIIPPGKAVTIVLPGKS